MNSFTSKFALLSALSAGALFSLGAYSAFAQTPWDVHRQQYQLSTGGTASNQTVGQTQNNRLQNQNTVQTGTGGGGQGTLPGRANQTEMSVTTQQTPGQTATTGTGRDLFQFTNQNAAPTPLPGGAEGITRYLQQGISVETATVPQLASAIAQYNATNSETIIGAIASLAAAYPDQAVKIAEAARLALPDRALEIAMAIATVVPSAAIQIVVALAAADPSLAPTLAGLILPAAGGINQTSSTRGTGTITQELTLRTTPGNTSASPTGGG